MMGWPCGNDDGYAFRAPATASTRKENRMTSNAPELQEILIEADNDEGWQPMATPGCFVKTLWHNEETQASYALVKFMKGSGVPITHIQASNQMMFCIRGKYEYTATN